jgi:hypothetical protein
MAQKVKLEAEGQPKSHKRLFWRLMLGKSEIMEAKPEMGLEGPKYGPKKYAPSLIAVKVYYSENELIDVIGRARKRGFSVLGPKSGERPSTSGIAEYLKRIEAEGFLFDMLRTQKAKEANAIIDSYGLSAGELLEARVKFLEPNKKQL